MNKIREINRYNLDKLFEIRESLSTEKDVLVELSLGSIHFYIGFEEIYKAILNSNIKIIDEQLDEENIISYQEEEFVAEPDAPEERLEVGDIPELGEEE